MSCSKIAQYMQRELDGDLTNEERLAMTSHLQTCDECESEFELLKQLSLELEQLPKVAPPFSLVDELIPRLKQHTDTDEPINVSRKFDWRKWSLLAGGLAAAVSVWALTERVNPTQLENYSAPTERAIQNERGPVALSEDLDRPLIEERSLGGDQRERTQAATTRALRQEVPEKVEPTPPAEIKTTPKTEPEDSLQSSEAPPARSKHDDSLPSQEEESYLTAAERPELAYSFMAPLEESESEEMDALGFNALSDEEPMTMRILAAPVDEDQTYDNPSPDGAWTAKIEGNQLIVFDKEGEEAFRSHLWDERATATVEWTDESRLRYRLQFPERDKIEVWIIDLAEKQEQKQ